MAAARNVLGEDEGRRLGISRGASIAPQRTSEGRVEPGGQLDMQQLLQAAAAMQSQLMSAQQELAEAEVQGTAGGGLVTATVNGQGELIDLTIDAAAIDTGDPEDTAQTVADLVLAAYRDALHGVDDLQQETMGPLAAGLGGGAAPGMPDLGAFPGFPGLPGTPAGQGQDEPPAQDDPASEK
jgi:DNA-binding YbaB/EbfC family protein